MSGRVTIACSGCAGGTTAAVVVNFYASQQHNASHEDTACRECAEVYRRYALEESTQWESWDYFLPLINPGTCTDDDIANVRAFVEVVARICRALWCDDAESREDRDTLTMACVEARVTRDVRCECTWPDVAPMADCRECNGTGIVFRDDARERLERAA